MWSLLLSSTCFLVSPVSSTGCRRERERERENRGGGGTYLLMVVELECTNSNRHQLLSRIFHLLPVVHVIIFVLFLSSFMLPSLTNSVNLNEHCTKDHQPQNIISNLYKFVEAGTIPVPYKGAATQIQDTQVMRTRNGRLKTGNNLEVVKFLRLCLCSASSSNSCRLMVSTGGTLYSWRLVGYSAFTRPTPRFLLALDKLLPSSIFSSFWRLFPRKAVGRGIPSF